MENKNAVAPISFDQKKIENLNESVKRSAREVDNRLRYSDIELKEFKELIMEKLDKAIIGYNLLSETLLLTDDNGTNDTSPTFKLLEDATEVYSKEINAQLATRQNTLIQQLRNALIRIENKTYGICTVSGKLIEKERLKSIPYTRLAVGYKKEE